MSDAALESICITGSRPPYKKPAWTFGEVDHERRGQISPEKVRQTDNRKTHLRPKSTPCRLNVSFKDNRSSRCARFGQVFSAKCRKYLDEPPPEESSIVLSPGYVLSRSREKINVTINTNDFFNEPKEENRRRKKTKQPDERDVRISQLVKQNDDLTLLLEEERLNYKFNLKKNKEDNLSFLDQIHNEHREHIIAIESDHADEIEKITKEFEQQIQDQQITADADKARIENQLQTLQGSFEAYKDTVATEMDYKWQRREKEVKHDCEKKSEEALSETRKELIHDKNKEIDAINKEHQRQIQVLVEDHAKEVDRLMEKFAECIEDSETLKKTLTEMKTMMQENKEVKEKLKITTDKLKKAQAELENKRAKLAGFEEHFAEKVAEVDNKYSMRMHGLMTDNTDLRHHYMKKCEDVLRLQSQDANAKAGTLRSAKDTMQTIIMARARTNISLAALRIDTNQEDKYENKVPNPKGTQLKRRKSLPTTQEEMTAALRQTTAVVPPLSTPKPPTLMELGTSQRQRPHTSMQYAKQTSMRAGPCSARVGGRTSIHLSQVDISEQGIDNLSARKQ